MARVPLNITTTRPMDNDGVQFRCPCHGGTQFVVYTKANIPYASCPVCGSVCEPMVRTSITVNVDGRALNVLR